MIQNFQANHKIIDNVRRLKGGNASHKYPGSLLLVPTSVDAENINLASSNRRETEVLDVVPLAQRT
jgi:hypothetical protein